MKIKLLFIAIIATFKLFSQIPAYVPTSGLVGWYPFNGNANDESGNNNNGTVNGAILTVDRFGVSNKAFFFDGINDLIQLNTLGSTIFENDFSISIWCEFQSFSNDYLHLISGQNNFITLNGNGNAYNNEIYKMSAYQGDAVQTNLRRIPYFSSNTLFQTSNYYNVILVKNGNVAKIYINGYLENYITTNNSIQIPSGNFIQIGSGFDNSQNYCFNGKLDDIGFWNRALTPQEITNLYLGCNINPVIPIVTNANIGQNAQITSNVTNCQYVWESNSNNLGWTIVPSNISYSNVTTNNLSINNIQVSNHLQEFRVIASQGNCVDTSNVSIIMVNDTCINTVNDTITTHLTVTDTLLINVSFAGLTPPNNSNTIKVYPNPANDFVIIDNGNFAMMSGYSVKITNSLGTTVFNSPINQAVFNVSTTTFGARGVYYIHILNSNNAIIDTREIVLQ